VTGTTNDSRSARAGLFFGGDQVAKHPPGGEAYGHLDARDPVTGERKWTIHFKYPPIGSVLSTAGDLVFHGDLEGVVRAYDGDSGAELWHFRTGSGHRGGPISYSVNGKQYIAVLTGSGAIAGPLMDQAGIKPNRNYNALYVYALP